jgi:hypothetical protein
LSARTGALCRRDEFGSIKLLGKEAIMEDFPLWLKLLVWLTIGGTFLYAIGAMIYSGMAG